MYFYLLEGFIPAEALLCVSFTAVTAGEIAQEFSDFWSPMWLRDARHAQFQSETWDSFQQILDDAPLPEIPDIHYPIGDMDVWSDIIRKLPRAKAVGPWALWMV